MNFTMYLATNTKYIERFIVIEAEKKPDII